MNNMNYIAVSGNNINRPPGGLTTRARLKLLVLEADEHTMDRIIEAIDSVCKSDFTLPQ